MEQELSGRAALQRIAEIARTVGRRRARCAGRWLAADRAGLGGSTLTLARTELSWDDPSTERVGARGEAEFAREDVLYQPELLVETVEEAPDPCVPSLRVRMGVMAAPRRSPTSCGTGRPVRGHAGVIRRQGRMRSHPPPFFRPGSGSSCPSTLRRGAPG